MPDHARRLRRSLPFIAPLVLFGLMAAFYVSGARSAYFGIFRIWGVHAWDFPFLDTDYIVSVLRCRRLAVDIFVTNPCDVLGRVYDYSPLWLVAAILPVTPAWSVPGGLAFGGLFLLSLTLLPPGRGWRETTIITLGTISSAAAFAVERGNNDLVIFALAVATAWLMRCSPGLRLVGYGCALLAGLLKYYPLALLAVAVRERPGRLVLLAATVTIILAVAIVLGGTDLVRVLALIPRGSYFGDMFGGEILPGGLTQTFGLPAAAIRPLEAAFIAAALVKAGLRARRPGFRSELEQLTDPERTFLLAGSLLLAGCFVSAENVSYRSVLLLLMLPGLTALARLGHRSALYTVSPWAGLAVLWAETGREWVETALPDFKLIQLAAWTVRELCWWWLFTAALALTAGLLLRSEAAQALFTRGRIPRRRNFPG